MKSVSILFSILLSGGVAWADDKQSLIDTGETVYKEVCSACHGAAADGDDRIAPPIFAAKNHYSNFTERDAFVRAVSAFILEPSVETAQMPGAIKKFELMPNLGLEKDAAVAVAEYLFATDLKAPEWYRKHYEEEHGEAPSEESSEKGRAKGKGKGKGKGKKHKLKENGE